MSDTDTVQSPLSIVLWLLCCCDISSSMLLIRTCNAHAFDFYLNYTLVCARTGVFEVQLILDHAPRERVWLVMITLVSFHCTPVKIDRHTTMTGTQWGLSAQRTDTGNTFAVSVGPKPDIHYLHQQSPKTNWLLLFLAVFSLVQSLPVHLSALFVWSIFLSHPLVRVLALRLVRSDHACS